MADRYVKVSGTSGDGLTPATAWTLAHFNANCVSGTTAHRALMLPGNYGNQKMMPAASGTSESNRVIYEAYYSATEQNEFPVTFNLTIDDYTFDTLQLEVQPPTVPKTYYFVPRKYISLRHLSFFSTMGKWGLAANGPSGRYDYLSIEYCKFHSSNPVGGYYNYPGGNPEGSNSKKYFYFAFKTEGNYFVLRNSIIMRWMGGDTFSSDGTHALYIDNDFNWCDNGHAPILAYGSYSVIKRNYIRNKWDRGGHFQVDSDTPTLDAVGIVVDQNTFFDNNFTGTARDGNNEFYPAVGSWMISNPGSDPGTIQIVKAAGTGMIFRNNLVVASNAGFYETAAYRSVLGIGDYDEDVNHMRHSNYYNNTFYNNYLNGVNFNKAYSDTDVAGNRFINNVISKSTTHSLWLRDPVAWPTPSSQQQFYYNNLLEQPIKFQNVDYANAGAFNTAQPNADGNISGPAKFRNPDYSFADTALATTAAQANAIRANKIVFNNFALANDSPGKGDGRHMAVIQNAGTVTTSVLQVDNARWCFNGYGITEPDQILVNGQIRTVVATSFGSPHTITVNSAVPVTNGQFVYWAPTGSTPDMGIIPTQTTAPPTSNVATPAIPTAGNPPVAIAAAVSTTSGTDVTLPAFLPPAGALILLIATANGPGLGLTAISPPPQVVGNFGFPLTWTRYEYEHGGVGNRVATVFFVARANLKPVSAALTVRWGLSLTNKIVNAVLINSGFPGTPILRVLTMGAAGGANNLTVAMTPPPAPTSVVIGALAARGTSPSIAHDPAAVELRESTNGANHAHQIQYIKGNAPGQMIWGSGPAPGTPLGGTANAAVVLEIAEGATAPMYEGTAAQASLPALRINPLATNGEHVVPQYNGFVSAALVLPALRVEEGEGSQTSLVYEGMPSEVELPALTMGTSTGLYRPSYTSEPSEIELPALVSDNSTGEHVLPVYEGANEITMPTLEMDEGTGWHTIPEYASSMAEILLPALAMSGIGVSGEVINEGAGVQLSLPALIMNSGVGAHALPVYEAENVIDLPALGISGTGIYSTIPALVFVVRAKVEI